MPGRLAMANSGPDTNDTHFFITETPYPSLNGKYTIWGQCENADVVKAISGVPRDPGDTPLTPVHIQHVIIERVGPAPADAPEAMPERLRCPLVLQRLPSSKQCPAPEIQVLRGRCFGSPISAAPIPGTSPNSASGRCRNPGHPRSDGRWGPRPAFRASHAKLKLLPRK